MKNYSKNTTIGKASTRSEIATQKLSLFALVFEREDVSPFPLQIEAIPDQDRLNPEWSCRFTYDESKQILETTRYWDFTVNKDRIPKCLNQLLSLIERVCSDRTSAKKQEVAA